ncbi:MAG TPA: hypothetical protein VHO25_23575, partial [Polyangiaceae bacterium]|nr:hypothetical protein [Polyangiaceae bacterium]
MSERALFGDAAVTLDDEVDGHADALLDSLFDDPWQIESDTANRESTPSPISGVAGPPVAAANRTAQPPAVNPAGPV